MRPLNLTQNDMCATSDKNTNFNISKNLLCKVGILNSLCSLVHYFQKTKWKLGAHIHQPMIRPPRACRGRTTVRFPANSSHVCFVELALKGVLFTRLGMRNRGSLRHRLSPLINPTVMPRDMAVRMCGLCMYSPCWHCFHCNVRLGNRIKFNCNS